MKYIGATDAFVRAPFVLEGIILGVIGAAIPLTALYFLYSSAVNYILTRFNVLTGIVAFIPVGEIYQILIPIGLALGIGIGVKGLPGFPAAFLFLKKGKGELLWQTKISEKVFSREQREQCWYSLAFI